MTIPAPFIIYGKLYDSDYELIPSGSIMLNNTIIQTNSGAKYIYNIQYLTSVSSQINISSKYKGEHKNIGWVVSLRPPSKRIDIVLDEISYKFQCLNTFKQESNKSLVLSINKKNVPALKISDINWNG